MANVDVSSNLERHVARRTFPLLARTKVCRNLFGPVDHEELHGEMKRKLQEISERDQTRWNFNFETNSPLPGDYEWEAISEDAMPFFYKDKVQNKRALATASVNATGDASSTSDCGLHGISWSPKQAKEVTHPRGPQKQHAANYRLLPEKKKKPGIQAG
ncbi:cyclin-dependent kinase inhibitor [Pimephales promelas]|nr:cyclin-dependent kinase inhibitor [Pimephales promelas]